MSNTRPLTTITTDKPGRPRLVRKRAETLIGTAGVEALRANDFFIIHGSLARELALIVEAPAKSEPLTPLEAAAEAAGLPELGNQQQKTQADLLSKGAPVNMPYRETAK